VRSAAEFLCKFSSSVGIDLDVGEINEMNVSISHFRSLKWETLTGRLYALIELTHRFAGNFMKMFITDI